MKVLGYDPYMSVDAAWALSRWVQHKTDLKSLYNDSDFISLHLPELESTKGMINAETIAQMKDGVKIINYARGGLVNEDDMIAALDSEKSLYTLPTSQARNLLLILMSLRLLIWELPLLNRKKTAQIKPLWKSWIS